MSRILAIDADASGLYVASGTMRKGAVTIDRASAITDDFPALTPENATALGAKIKALLKQAGIAAAPAVFLVGRDKLFLKEVRHPPVPGSEEPAVVKFQAVKELNENADDMILDYLPLGPTPDGGRKSMAMFVRKDYLKATKDLCDAAGLKLVAATPRPYAAASSLKAALAKGAEPPDVPNEPVALLYPTGTAAEFCVVRGDDVLFSRPVPASALLSESVFVAEIRRNLAVVSGQVSGMISALYLAEADAPGGGWAGRLQAVLPISVRTFDPLAGSPAGNAVPPQYRGRFAAAVGAIHLKSVPGPLPINFVSPRQPKAEPNKHRAKYLYLALAACLLLGLGLFGGLWLVGRVNGELAELEARKADVEGDLNKLALNAKRSAAADEFMKHQVRLHDEMYDWTDLFPEIKETRVLSIDFASIGLPDKKVRAEEEKLKEKNPAYKPPPKTVGTVTFTIQTKDRAHVNAFVNVLASQPKNYAKVTSQGGSITGTGSTNQNYTVKAEVFSRTAEQYIRKLNVTLPKAKPKSADPDDEFGSPVGAPGISAPFGGGELP